MSKYKYGYIPDLGDQRDFLYAVPSHVTLPAAVDLSPRCPPVYDQGNLGSCTAQAIAAAYQFDAIRQSLPHNNIMPSRLFIYYNERLMEGTVNSDSGAMIRDGIKSIAKQGVCAASYWAYVIAKFAVKPPQSAYIEAAKHLSVQYSRITQVDALMKGCLAEGFPFVIGISVYQSFESAHAAQTGIIPMPARNEKLLGGHAILITGYSDQTGMYKFRNSWGMGWGSLGYGFLHYAYLQNNNLAADAWTVRVVK